MTESPHVLRFAAFSGDASGGNPAGVVLDASQLDDAAMQRIAAEVDDAETAFVTGRAGDAHVVRYFSPIAEVPFCGHATVATAVALVAREGVGASASASASAGAGAGARTVRFSTPVGEIVIETSEQRDGGIRAAFTSVDTELAPIPDFVLDALLDLLGLDRTQIAERYPPRLAFAGNWHPVLVIAEPAVFDGFEFEPTAVRAFMDAQGWPATITVLHPLDAPAAGDADADADAGASARPQRFEARNLFPVGRITEDPATGSAAAAVGGYLRGLCLVEPPARIVIEQGRHVGRPGELTVDIPASGGIVVSGQAVPITAPAGA